LHGGKTIQFGDTVGGSCTSAGFGHALGNAIALSYLALERLARERFGIEAFG